MRLTEKRKLPVGAGALRATELAASRDCLDARSRKAECGGYPGTPGRCCRHAWMRPSVSPPPPQDASKGTPAMQTGAWGLARAEANDAMPVTARKAGILSDYIKSLRSMGFRPYLNLSQIFSNYLKLSYFFI